MGKDKIPVKPPVKVETPAPPKATPPAKVDPPVQLTEQEKENIRGALAGRERSLKALLNDAKDMKNKDRIKGLLADLEKEKAEWKKKGI